MNRMMKLVLLLLAFVLLASAMDLPTKKWLNLAAIKTLVAAAEAEAQKRNVQVTLCIVDESGNLLFLQKADGAGLNTIEFARKKAPACCALRAAVALAAAEQLKSGNLQVLAFPEAFPNQAASRFKWMERPLEPCLASGAPSEVDEAIVQVAIDALLKK